MTTEQDLQEAFKAVSTSLRLANLSFSHEVVPDAMVQLALRPLQRKIETLLELLKTAPPMVFRRTELDDWIVRSLSSPAPDSPEGL